MKKRVSRNFYNQPTLTVAKKLLGKYLVRKVGRKTLAGKIVETEAYIGPKDKAAHTYGGKITERNKTVYLDGGHTYIYLCYGINWMLNLTTRGEGIPECVLIRALEPCLGNYQYPGEYKHLTNGPGKLCRWLKLDRSLNEEDLIRSKEFWLEDRGGEIKKSQIVTGKRIGIDYAGVWADKPWRFYLKDNLFVSRK
jgi:DNA-3-methyladenine glycosylase